VPAIFFKEIQGNVYFFNLGLIVSFSLCSIARARWMSASSFSERRKSTNVAVEIEGASCTLYYVSKHAS